MPRDGDATVWWRTPSRVAGHRQPARGALLGVEATLPGGHHARFGSAAMKDVAGLDAKRLIAGGRGAFGRVGNA